MRAHAHTNTHSRSTYDTHLHSRPHTRAQTQNLSVKQKLFAELDAVAPAHTIFASNTSSLSITDIAKDVKRKVGVC